MPMVVKNDHSDKNSVLKKRSSDMDDIPSITILKTSVHKSKINKNKGIAKKNVKEIGRKREVPQEGKVEHRW